MIRQSFFREINKAKRTRRKSHLKLRGKYKWLIDSPVDRLSKEFKEVQQSLYTGLCSIRKELKDVTKTLNSGLCAIDQHFTTFETPIEKAAEKIARSFENFDKSKDILSKELREEYHAELKMLVDELRSYAHQLVETNNIQIERSTKLEKDIYDLSKLSVLLSDTLKIFGTIARKTDKKQKDEESIFGFSEELLTEFTRQYKSNNENFERLFNSVSGKLSQVSEHINNQSEINRRLLRCMGKLSDDINSMSKSFKEWEKVVHTEEKKEKAADHGAEQPDERINKMDSLIELLSEGFQGLKDQNELLVKKIKIMSDHLKLLSKPIKVKIRGHLRKTVRT